MSASIMLFVGGTSTGMMLCLVGITLVHLWRTGMITRRRESGAVPTHEADCVPWRVRAVAPWIRLLMYRGTLVLVLILAYGLFATFAIAQPTLEHVDPVVFAALQGSLLLPISLVILGWTWRSSTSASVRLGLVGGLPLGLGFVCVALSLHTLGIVPSALLTALEGLMASVISWLAFRRPLSLLTCLAAGCACGGLPLPAGKQIWSRWRADCSLPCTLFISNTTLGRCSSGGFIFFRSLVDSCVR